MADIPTVLLILGSIGIALLILAGFAFFAVRLAMRLSLRASGWAALAQRYAAEEPPAGQTVARQTVRVGRARYRHSVQIVVAPQGLWLSMQPSLAQSPALLIPWCEIKGTQKTRLYSREAIQLSIGDPPTTTIAVYAKLFETMSPYIESCA
jgi:hypothetical protein